MSDLIAVNIVHNIRPQSTVDRKREDDGQLLTSRSGAHSAHTCSVSVGEQANNVTKYDRPETKAAVPDRRYDCVAQHPSYRT